MIDCAIYSLTKHFDLFNQVDSDKPVFNAPLDVSFNGMDAHYYDEK